MYRNRSVVERMERLLLTVDWGSIPGHFKPNIIEIDIHNFSA